ncbi:TPA: hypothetical protein MD614_003276 [Escherichia coli]|uniref:Ead/Ea22-like family protein n=1 Tax=Escherichia coli TaxID=562 RepID=A0A3P5HE66_ECOLX|nr:hypothetical protein BANRA_05674 [Escherichia coli]HBU8290268.1 hypothetical protein [Escherichia coli]HBV7866430.1 hypothetical protein [Escherichia coli]
MKSEGLTPAQLAERNAEYVTEISRLEKACAALAAENAGLNVFIEEECFVYSSDTPEPIDANDCKPETKVTDAFLAEVRALGLEMFAQKCNSKSEQSFASDIRDNWKLLGEHATDFAAELRKGGKQ